MFVYGNGNPETGSGHHFKSFTQIYVNMEETVESIYAKIIQYNTVLSLYIWHYKKSFSIFLAIAKMNVGSNRDPYFPFSTVLSL